MEDSTLLICGYQLEFDSLRRNTIRNLTFIMKVGRDGEQIWKKEYYKSKSGGGGMIVKSNKNDEFIITETSRDFSITNAKNYYSQIWLYAIDTSGIVQWEYITPPQELMESNQVINTKDNGFLFSGVSLRLEVHNPWVFYRHFQGVIYKIDSNKNYVWSVKPDTSFTSFIVSATELSDGSIIAVGGWNSKPFDGWMLKISTLGEIIWQRRYSLLADEYGNHELTQAIAGPGGFIYAIGGVSGKDDNYYWRSWLLKLDSMGCVVPGCHTTGINDFKTPDSRILIYPNPASEVLNIFTPDLGTPHKYRIINSLGQTVKAWKGNAGEITYIIPLDDFKEGMYYLEVTAGNTLLSTEKFIVSK
ncbi:MAG TPA: T9SS type A sorting domain-containing protein [Bacteroidia bacterium]|nr:T9SS type A sorting domain-containing protein [Bacteroidia bacterium]